MNSYAQAYITAVETADGQSLETWYKNAVNRLVIDLIRTSAVTQASLDNFTPNLYIHLFCGARSLTGMLIPLFTNYFYPMNNFGFVLADYNRKTGLKADGSKRLEVGQDYPNNLSNSAGYWQQVSTNSMCVYCNITETHSDPTQYVIYMSTQTSAITETSDIWVGQVYNSNTLETYNTARVRGGSLSSNSSGSNRMNIVSTGLTGMRRVVNTGSSNAFGNRRQTRNGTINTNAFSIGSSASLQNGNGTFKFFNVATPATGFSNGNFRMNLVAFGETLNPTALESCLLTFLNTLDQNNFSSAPSGIPVASTASVLVNGFALSKQSSTLYRGEVVTGNEDCGGNPDYADTGFRGELEFTGGSWRYMYGDFGCFGYQPSTYTNPSTNANLIPTTGWSPSITITA
jgi:hypothetical protein